MDIHSADATTSVEGNTVTLYYVVIKYVRCIFDSPSHGLPQFLPNASIRLATQLLSLVPP